MLGHSVPVLWINTVKFGKKLTHLSLASHKRDIYSVDSDQMPQNAASDQSTLLALNSEIFTKHDHNKINQTPLI